MSNTLKKKRDTILKLLNRLTEMSAKDIPIIVEGRKDVNALHVVKDDIISAKTSGRRFLYVLSEVGRREKRELILLMDFDRRCREWTKRLMKHLEEMR